MKRLTRPRSWCCVGALAALCLWVQPQASAQEPPPPQGTSRGENFSAKPPAALFASDCTGAGCHKGPQGLGRSVGIGGLAGFLREHYTNSRESAAALANYLSKLPSGPDPRDARTPQRGGKPTAVAPASGAPGWGEGRFSPGQPVPPRPVPDEARVPRPTPPAATPPATTSRASVKPDDDPSGDAAKPADSKPGEARPAEAAPRLNPAARAQRGRQPTAAVASPQPAEPEAAPPPPPPPPKEFDIFD